MKKYILLYFVLLPCCIYAQSGVVTPYGAAPIVIDTITRKTTSPLPFDRSFNLQYTLNTADSIFHVFAYETFLDRSDPARVSRQLLFVKTTMTPSMQPALIRSITDTFKNVVIIHADALKPNTMVDIAMLRKLNNREIAWLLAYNENYYTEMHAAAPNAVNRAGLQALYDQFIEATKDRRYAKRIPFQKFEYTNYHAAFNTTFDIWLTAIKSRDYIHYTPLLPLGAAAIDMSAVFTTADLLAFDASLRGLKLADDDLLPLASVVREGRMVELLAGRVDITAKYPADLAADAADYKGRMVNLGAVQIYLDKVIALLERAQLNGIVLPPNLYDNVIGCRTLVKASKDIVKTNYMAMLRSIRTNEGLNKEMWLISGNDFSDLTSLSKSVLIPELGVTTLVLKGHDQYHIYPRPFVGVDIYLRPVDKTIRSVNYPKNNKDLLRTVSLQIGLTYGSLNSKEFSSLFNDFSVMGGLGFRIGRWFRLSGGTVLTQQTDANPIITTTHTNFGYYAAFSFDLDILSNASSLTGRIFK